MAVLIVLGAATVLSRLVGAAGVSFLDSWPEAIRTGLAVMLLFTGSAHFNSMRHDLVRMVPPAIPRPMAFIYFTGVCEILGGIGLLIPSTRFASPRVAGLALAFDGRCGIYAQPAAVPAGLSDRMRRAVAYPVRNGCGLDG